MAYYYLAKKAKQYTLLAPFISNIEDIEKLEKRPYFYKTNYSPVVNDIVNIKVYEHKRREDACNKLLKDRIPEGEKTLIYFPTPYNIANYINSFIRLQYPILTKHDPYMESFLEWAKNEIHEEWNIVSAAERGFLVHHGQMPLCVRNFFLDRFENSEQYNRLFCTSTLLEGVNTVAKNLIIVKPSPFSYKPDNNNDFSAFDFFNLVGRTGRLNQYYIGTAYYIKTPNDPNYQEQDAIKSIRFELTDESLDIDIQTNEVIDDDEYLNFLSILGITSEDYKNNIGSNLRFESVIGLYERFCKNKKKLFDELQKLVYEPTRSRYFLLLILEEISQKNKRYTLNLDVSTINHLLDRRRLKIRDVVNNILDRYANDQKYSKSNKLSIDSIIANTIRLKSSYIEHDFYKKVKIVRYFMTLDNFNEAYIDKLDVKVLGAIEYLYFTTSKHMRMLMDIGIYEHDLEKVAQIIGKDYEDIHSMKKLLKENEKKMDELGFISKFIIH